jgi:hypothetical protein
MDYNDGLYHAGVFVDVYLYIWWSDLNLNLNYILHDVVRFKFEF